MVTSGVIAQNVFTQANLNKHRRLEIMNLWWCMDCRAAVELNRHGRCWCCESEAVDLMEETGALAGKVSMSHEETMVVSACS
jgi:ABC-type ATPase with predicted acetyltransferase domain